MRFATYSTDGQTFFGAVTKAGMIALNDDFPNWPTLLDAVQADGLSALAQAAAGKTVSHTEFEYEMVLPNARRILCVGVNFPDRNAEYKDGNDQPKYMSLFPRFASGFTGHDRPLIRPQKTILWIMREKWPLSSAKQDGAFHKRMLMSISRH